MSKCPKCGRKLRITDISQFCPGCGVNMRFYNYEENFLREAKYAELSQARLKIMMRNLRYSFLGSKLVTAKLIVMLLPTVSLLIPAGTFGISFPFYSVESQFGLLGLVNVFTDGSLGYIFEMTGSEYTGVAFSALRNALFAYIAVTLFAVLCLFFSLCGFISIKNMQKLTTVSAGLGIVASAVTMVMISVFASKTDGIMLVDGKLGFGLIVSVLMFVAVLVVNILLWKKGIHPVYDEGVEERYAIFKKLKAGEVNLDSLPQPVVETAKTREIEAAIAAEEAKFREKYAVQNEKKEGVE